MSNIHGDIAATTNSAGAGNRPPHLPWPPENEPQPALVDDDGIDGWDRRAAALLDALDGDEPVRLSKARPGGPLADRPHCSA